ncbi:MAG: replication-associated recombination protein A [Gammaproteobacteria bacterium]|nr:replication-associated recombination protein A [Gammaproteobacteria bacterium]
MVGKVTAPLAARLRPEQLEDFVGQKQLLGKGKPIWSMLNANKIYSMILWGPPGTGKTTLARLIAKHFTAAFEQISAVMGSVKDIREIVHRAQQRLLLKERTILFVDEVHRFNKAQQDAFLPYVEDGTLIFIGATTENPSFELNYALLSRAKVFVLDRLSFEDLELILNKAISDKLLSHKNLQITDDAKASLVRMADGDARRLLNRLEWVVSISNNDNIITIEHIELMLNGENRRFDKQGEIFYDQISALHKAIRGTDPDAALYWLCRMLDGGCDPIYIARRLTRAASEDIGNADPRALSICLDAWEVLKRLGSPEGELALAQAVIYLSVAAKSNAGYVAFGRAMHAVKTHGSLEVPKHLRNAPTKLMKNLGYGKDYRYAHNEPEAYAVGEKYFPNEMSPEIYYEPVERGLEINIKKKLDYLKSLDKQD